MKLFSIYDIRIKLNDLHSKTNVLNKIFHNDFNQQILHNLMELLLNKYPTNINYLLYRLYRH